MYSWDTGDHAHIINNIASSWSYKTLRSIYVYYIKLAQTTHQLSIIDYLGSLRLFDRIIQKRFRDKCSKLMDS